MAKYNFCTLFDRNYLFKGLALHNSLMKFCRDFKLWILVLDDQAYGLLKELNLANVELISLKEFEDAQLLQIKSSRSPVEYCWTATPSLPLYILEHNPEIDSISYLDADLFFYSDPEPIYNELKERSILIVGHNYSEKYIKYEKTHGKYNVQFLVFKNDANSRECLQWWRQKCIEWCYLRYEEGKWGDQKYLDDWPERFKGVGVIQHIGAGVAPWNVEKYSIKIKDNKVFIDGAVLIFYHFHQLNIINKNVFDLSRGYFLPNPALELIYKPYLRELSRAINSVLEQESGFNYGFDLEYALRPSSFKSAVKNFILRNKPIKNMIRKYGGRCFGKYYYLVEL